MTPSDLLLERMTWPQVRDALAAGMRTIIVPCGAIEQHGPHLPLLVDADHGDRLGDEVARRLGNALVAPTIRVGCSDHHMDFPGTISLRSSTFTAVCRDYCMSLARHGFEKICMLPSHGGNFRPLADVVADLDAAVGPDCRVVAFTDLVAVIATWQRVVEEEEGLGHRVGGHADIAESSILLHMHPDLVDFDKVQQGFHPELDEEILARIIREGFLNVTPNGILGDARGLSDKIGRRCIDELADVMAAYYRGAGA